MVPDSDAGELSEDGDSSESNFALNALIGAVAGIVLSFIPLSTLLGGGIAGYLQGGQTNDGLKVGGLAGLIMLVPFVLIGFLILVFFIGIAPASFSLMVIFMAVLLLIFGAVYTVGLSMVGGYLGVYVKNEL